MDSEIETVPEVFVWSDHPHVLIPSVSGKVFWVGRIV